MCGLSDGSFVNESFQMNESGRETISPNQTFLYSFFQSSVQSVNVPI